MENKTANQELPSQEIDLFSLLLIALRGWRLILICMLILGAAGFIYKSLGKTQYQASAVLWTGATAPDYLQLDQQTSSRNAAGQSNIVGATYDVVMNSKEFLNEIAKHQYSFKTADGKTFSGTIPEYFKQPGQYVIDQLLPSMIKFNYAKKDGLLTVNVITANPEFSAQLANQITVEANRYYQVSVSSSAKEGLLFTEKRLNEVKKELEESQKKLVTFLRSNRGANNKVVTPESTPSTSEMQLYNFELEKYRNEVDLKVTLVNELSRKYEIIKIEAQKELPTITVVKYAEIPTKPLAKGRLKAAAASGFAGCILALIYLFIQSQLTSETKKTLIETLKKS